MKDYIKSKDLCYGGNIKIYDNGKVVIKCQDDTITVEELKELLNEHHLRIVDRRIIGE